MSEYFPFDFRRILSRLCIRGFRWVQDHIFRVSSRVEKGKLTVLESISTRPLFRGELCLSANHTIWYFKVNRRPLILYSAGCVMRSNYFCILCESLSLSLDEIQPPVAWFPATRIFLRATGISCGAGMSAKYIVNCAILSFVRFIFPLMFPPIIHTRLFPPIVFLSFRKKKKKGMKNTPDVLTFCRRSCDETNRQPTTSR